MNVNKLCLSLYCPLLNCKSFIHVLYSSVYYFRFSLKKIRYSCMFSFEWNKNITKYLTCLKLLHISYLIDHQKNRRDSLKTLPTEVCVPGSLGHELLWSLLEPLWLRLIAETIKPCPLSRSVELLASCSVETLWLAQPSRTALGVSCFALLRAYTNTSMPQICIIVYRYPFCDCHSSFQMEEESRAIRRQTSGKTCFKN